VHAAEVSGIQQQGNLRNVEMLEILHRRREILKKILVPAIYKHLY